MRDPVEKGSAFFLTIAKAFSSVTPMASATFILFWVQILLVGLTLVLACLYSLLIVFVRRFRDRLNVFTFNLCLANIVCCLVWLIYDLLTQFDPLQLLRKETCRLMIYAQMMCTLHLPLAFLVVSIHRCCSIINHSNVFFKSQRWMILCLICQWSVGFLLPLPLFSENSTCWSAYWQRIYAFLIVVIIPSTVSAVINAYLVNYVHRSYRRIQPQIANDRSRHRRVKLNRRDIRLLRHMIFMFSIFVGGWSPIYVMSILISSVSFHPLLLRSVVILAKMSLFLDIVYLFMYNHRVRSYLGNLIRLFL